MSWPGGVPQTLDYGTPCQGWPLGSDRPGRSLHSLALVGVALALVGVALVGVASTLLGVAWDRQARWPALVGVALALVGVALVGVAFTLLGVALALVGVDRSALALGELLGPRSVRWSWPPRSERQPGAEKEGSKRKEGRGRKQGRPPADPESRLRPI